MSEAKSMCPTSSPVFLVEEQMNFTFIPSPEHITLAKTAIELWSEDDVRVLAANFYFQSTILSIKQKNWQEVEDKVIEKLPKLLLPESLKKKVLDFIKPIGLEILKWKNRHEIFVTERRFVRDNLHRLCWTPQGTVDKKKTAEVLVKDESLDVTPRYKLACIYCLESYIEILWNKIPEDQKKYFYSEDPSYLIQPALVVFWTYVIKGEEDKLDSIIALKWLTPYEYAFESAVMGGNKAATEYFLQKVTADTEESLPRTAGYVAKRRSDTSRDRSDFPDEYYTDVLCFLLSQMDEDQQEEVFISNPSEVLECFLEWPWQSFFMEAAKYTWNFLPEDDYEDLLKILIDRMIDGYKDYNYHKLFGEFWLQSPNSHKRYVIKRCSSGFLLSDLFEIEDWENISLIVKNATLAEKEELIFSDRGKDICKSLIFRGYWSSAISFVGECVTSKEKIIELRDEFKECNSWYYSKEELATKEDTWNKFFQLLDGLIQNYDK